MCAECGGTKLGGRQRRRDFCFGFEESDCRCQGVVARGRTEKPEEVVRYETRSVLRVEVRNGYDQGEDPVGRTGNRGAIKNSSKGGVCPGITGSGEETRGRTEGSPIGRAPTNTLNPVFTERNRPDTREGPVLRTDTPVVSRVPSCTSSTNHLLTS